jgi:hypothetical protein
MICDEFQRIFGSRLEGEEDLPQGLNLNFLYGMLDRSARAVFSPGKPHETPWLIRPLQEIEGSPHLWRWVRPG